MPYTQQEIKQRLEPIFMSFPIKKVVLFGSYAKGTQTAKSDIDLMIDSDGQIRGIEFFGVLEIVTNALEIDVDLIEASQIIIGSRVHREILDTGVVIYECA